MGSLNEKASVIVNELTRRLGVEQNMNGEEEVAEIRVADDGEEARRR